MGTFSETFKSNQHWRDYILQTQKYKFNWAEGAYRSSKSVSNTLAFALYLETTPDKLHLVIASTVASARAIVEDGDGALGLKYYFTEARYRSTKYKGNDAGIIKTSTGEKIVVYLGGCMESSFKAFRGWSVGGIVLEELNLLHENTINEARGRNLMATNPKFFISHNPVANGHPIYKWLDELDYKELVNYDHSTIYDNPALTDERREEIVGEFDPDSIFYKQYILGERVDAEGMIFNVRDYNIIDEWKPEDYNRFLVCCDPGENGSGTSILLAGLLYNEKLKQNEIHILKEYWHRNMDKENSKNPKLPRDYARDYCLFIQEISDIVGRFPEAVLIDEDITFYRELCEVFNEFEFIQSNIKYVIKKDIEERIRTGVNLLFKGKLRFYKECKNTINQFKNDKWDAKQMEKGQFKRFDNPLISNIDCVDCTEYLCTWWNKYLYI